MKRRTDCDAPWSISMRRALSLVWSVTRTVADVISAPGLVDSVFQGLTGFEGRNFTSGDFDGRASLRVTARTGSTLAHGESTETYQSNLVTLFQGFTHSVNEASSARPAAALEISAPSAILSIS